MTSGKECHGPAWLPERKGTRLWPAFTCHLCRGMDSRVFATRFAAAPPWNDDEKECFRAVQLGPLSRGGVTGKTSSADNVRASEGSMIGMPSRTG